MATGCSCKALVPEVKPNWVIMAVSFLAQSCKTVARYFTKVLCCVVLCCVVLCCVVLCCVVCCVWCVLCCVVCCVVLCVVLCFVLLGSYVSQTDLVVLMLLTLIVYSGHNYCGFAARTSVGPFFLLPNGDT
jgi:hypothetical protein